MTGSAIDFDNGRVYLSVLDDKGRGLFARQDLAEDDLIIRSPVKLFNAMEYEILRFVPAIRSYLAGQPEHGGDGRMVSLKIGLDRLFDDPDAVLSATTEEESAASTIMYTFTWPRPDDEGGDTAAIAFGLISMCNHAPEAAQANAKLVRDHEAMHIDLVATRDIARGEEILISYASVPFEPV